MEQEQSCLGVQQRGQCGETVEKRRVSKRVADEAVAGM